ncbi:type I methionyl aminopeptidase [Kineosporia sp. J2-2]|uniref:Methionine aminopeptidase n=1 Tax=Kineosporia corallincola TaxID=2835133 RepID=A0ABS5T9Y3_9ACTN|nr:type I methionyl aminopeptidase [Kineosporia corallincola]MBT0767870.1 type I methionyl aminopeptidase [Kineosporia corallincola]
MLGRDRIQYKTPDQVRLMRAAGLIVADALDAVRAALAPGLTTGDLDRIANELIVGRGATPSFLNYGHPPYPATLCVSVNDEVVHGIPGSKVLKAGDVVSIDCGAILKGWHGDSAFTAVVPGAGDERTPEQVKADQDLIDTTEESMWRGIAAIAAGDRLNAVGIAVEDFVGDRFGLVEDYGGHGIGTEMHQEPHVLNYRTRDRGPKLKPGICLAIEPMLTAGGPDTKVLSDDWTVATTDGGKAAHWEHSVALLEDGLWVLTARDGGVAKLSGLGAKISALATEGQ